MNQTLPNFFLVGAMKAGTTSLYNYLKEHPDVYMSPIKEPNYFSFPEINPHFFKSAYRLPTLDLDNYLRGSMREEVHIAYLNQWETYLRLFKHVVQETVIGEASTSYLYSKEAANNIRKIIPHAKIMIILRDPIERAYSHYCMDVAIGLTRDGFVDAIKRDIETEVKGWGITGLYVELGLYYQQVKRYLDLFPEEQVKVYLFDDLKTNFGQTFREIADFLEIDSSYFSKEEKHYNERQWPRLVGLNHWLHKLYIKDVIRTCLPRSLIQYGKSIYYGNQVMPSLSEQEVNYLQSLFKEDVKQLSELINRDLSLWKTNRNS